MTDKQLIEWGLHPSAITHPFLSDLGVSNTFAERFVKKVTKSSGCWEFPQDVKYPKYAAVGRGFKGKGSLGAHIASYALHNGENPKGKDVCHSCDNRKCVNPAHLWLGTRFENMVDCNQKGRLSTTYTISRKSRGEKHARAIFTNEQVLDIVQRNKSQSYDAIAAHYGCSQSAIAFICQGKTWIHVTGIKRLTS